MTETISTRQLCNGLGLSKSRLDQWVARDLISPEREATAGPSGRKWSKEEAIKVAVFDRLLEAGVSAAHAKVALQFIHGFTDDTAFLVMSTGLVGRIIPSSSRGAPAPSDDESAKVHTPGQFDYDVIRGRDLGKHLSNQDFYASIVVNLETIEVAVLEVFEQSKA